MPALQRDLADRGDGRVVLAGIATNLGVESTARASDLDLEVVLVEDAMTALSEAEHKAAITLSLPHFGTVLTTEEVLTGPASAPRAVTT